MYIDNDGVIIYYEEFLTHIRFNIGTRRNEVSFLISRVHLSEFRGIEINKIIYKDKKDKIWKEIKDPDFLFYEIDITNYFELKVIGESEKIDESIIRDIKINKIICT